MKPKIVFLILCSILFTCISCKNEEAIDFFLMTNSNVKRANILSIEKDSLYGFVTYDTMFYISHIYGDSLSSNIDSIKVDSICIVKSVYPAVVAYDITYIDGYKNGKHIENCVQIINEDSIFYTREEYMDNHCNTDYNSTSHLPYNKVFTNINDTTVFLENDWLYSKEIIK